MMSDKTRRNLRVVFVLAMAMFSLLFVALGLSGCEDDGDTTIIYEEGDIIMSTNSTGIAIKDNNGTVSVTQTTSADSPTPTIAISGNTGRVYVVTSPEEKEAALP